MAMCEEGEQETVRHIPFDLCLDLRSVECHVCQPMYASHSLLRQLTETTCQVYHFLLDAWPFFATLTIASYVLVFITTVVSVLCRLHFGLGLTEHRKKPPHSIPDPS
jgi:hypothetical protein